MGGVLPQKISGGFRPSRKFLRNFLLRQGLVCGFKRAGAGDYHLGMLRTCRGRMVFPREELSCQKSGDARDGTPKKQVFCFRGYFHQVFGRLGYFYFGKLGSGGLKPLWPWAGSPLDALAGSQCHGEFTKAE